MNSSIERELAINRAMRAGRTPPAALTGTSALLALGKPSLIPEDEEKQIWHVLEADLELNLTDDERAEIVQFLLGYVYTPSQTPFTVAYAIADRLMRDRIAALEAENDTVAVRVGRMEEKADVFGPNMLMSEARLNEHHRKMHALLDRKESRIVAQEIASELSKSRELGWQRTEAYAQMASARR